MRDTAAVTTAATPPACWEACTSVMRLCVSVFLMFPQQHRKVLVVVDATYVLNFCCQDQIAVCRCRSWHTCCPSAV